MRVETLPLQRGKQLLEMDVSELDLPPGNYTLIAFEGQKDKEKSASFRVVETPWQEQ